MKKLARILFIIWLCFLCEKSFGFSFAELSYNLITGNCPTEIKESSKSNCTFKLQTSSYRDFAVRLSEDTFMAGLADLRSQSLSCARDQINVLEDNEKDLEEFIEFYSQSLRQIGKEKRTMQTLLPAITLDNDAKEKYKESRLRAEAILSALPFSQAPAMRLMINDLVIQTSQNDYMGSETISPAIEKSIQDSIKTALLKSKKEFQENNNVMRMGIRSLGETLSTEAKESLAQDTDLVEDFRQRSEINDADLAPMACRVDAKYGRGAKYRDNAILATSVLGTGAAMGLTRLGVAGITSTITGAAAAGAFSIRTAGVLRVVAGVAGSATIYKQVESNCLGEVSLKGLVKEPKTCEKNIVKSLGNDKCTLNIVLSALGGRALYKGFNLGKREIQEGAGAWEKVTAKGARAEAFAIEKGANNSFVKAENSKLLKAFHASAPSRSAVNAPINTTPRAGYNVDIPKPMRDKIRQLKEKIDKTEFDPPILAKKNGYTNAKWSETPEDFLPADTKMSQGLLNSFSDLHNKQKFADYIDDLVGEVTRRMLSSGNVALKAKARTGIIDQETLIAVLTDRLKARGLNISMIPKDTGVLNFRGFQKFIREGPVVDEALGPGHRLADTHGVYPHVLQLDYVLPSIEKEVGRDKLPVVFEYFGTDRGLKYWNETFDLFSSESKTLSNTNFLKKNIMDKNGLNLP